MKNILTEFQAGKNDIVYVSDEFKRIFANLSLDEDPKPLYTKRLGKSMNSKEILAELHPGVVTLDDILAILSEQKYRDLLGIICYIKDTSGTEWLVIMTWFDWGRDEGWDIRAFPSGSAYRWFEDRHAVSRVLLTL